jgi:hypothetical protein
MRIYAHVVHLSSHHQEGEYMQVLCTYQDTVAHLFSFTLLIGCQTIMVCYFRVLAFMYTTELLSTHRCLIVLFWHPFSIICIPIDRII